MKLKKLLIGTAISLALVVPATAYAATSTSTTATKIRGIFGIDSSKLNASQLADIADYSTKMKDLQKSMLDKMVSNGSMTQAQADAKKAQIDAKSDNGDKSADGKHGKLDTSKLTDTQKSTLLDLKKQQLTLQGDLSTLLVEQNLITQAQATAMKTHIDTAIADLTTSNLNDNMMMGGKSDFGMLQDITLTDAQKTALSGWETQSAAVQKKIVALYVEAGIITQAQADTMNTQIDTKAANPFTSNKMGNGKMGGKRGH